MGDAAVRRQNYLLDALSPSAWQLMSAPLELVSLTRDQELNRPGREFSQVYFPINCTISLLAIEENGATPEFAAVGCEGVVGVPAFMGITTARSLAVVRSSGEAYSMHVGSLRTVFERDSAWRQALLRYTHALLAQIVQVALCNQRHTVSQRLCRWLLNSTDWLPGSTNRLAMTHERIARLLDVRREGVTVAAGQLQSAGIIRYRRGQIDILDRAALEAQACECYQVISREFERARPHPSLVVCEPAPPVHREPSRCGRTVSAARVPAN